MKINLTSKRTQHTQSSLFHEVIVVKDVIAISNTKEFKFLRPIQAVPDMDGNLQFPYEIDCDSYFKFSIGIVDANYNPITITILSENAEIAEKFTEQINKFISPLIDSYVEKVCNLQIELKHKNEEIYRLRNGEL